MKTNKLLVTILILLMSSFAFQACLDDEVVDFGKGPIIINFTQKSVTSNFVKKGTGEATTYEVPIFYVGGKGLPLNEVVTVTVGIDESSSAIEGTQFELLQTEYTIPAGETTVNALIKVYADELDVENPKDVVLKIVSSSDNVTVSDAPKTTITLQAVCLSELEGDYTYANGNLKSVTLTSTGVGTYSVSADNYFRGDYPLYISDVCGTITVTGGFLPDNFGINVSGRGSVDYETGTITIYYTADGYFSEIEMILEKN